MIRYLALLIITYLKEVNLVPKKMSGLEIGLKLKANQLHHRVQAQQL